jgi:hypothetical protein
VEGNSRDLNRASILEFVWRDRGKQRKSSAGLVGVPDKFVPGTFRTRFANVTLESNYSATKSFSGCLVSLVQFKTVLLQN